MTDAETSVRATNIDDMLNAAARAEDGWHYHIGNDWMQGRTAYGGISAALSLDAVTRELGGAHPAPLRSAQIGFFGPVGGDVHVKPRLLRQSKSSLFAASDLVSEAGYGTHASFAFMSGRDSHIDHSHINAPDVPDAASLISIPEHSARPAFARKFDMRPIRGPGFGHGLDEGDILTWVRWRETPSIDPHVALLALADALPPAALPLFREFGPISSSTWIQHFLTDEPDSKDGWWLLHSHTDHAARGFSAQDMRIWNSDRQLVSVGGQGVAIYC